ncbi:MAG: DUF6259 domain-containing protein, partial [Thermoplasmatales archaeon]
NRFIELVITFGNNTGGGIYGIIDKSTGVDFVRRKDAVDIGLFVLEYWSEERGWYQGMLGRNAKKITYDYRVWDDGVQLNITWSGLSSTEAVDKYFDVTVSVSIYVPSGSKRSYWYISVDSRDDTVIERIVFPLIVGVSQIADPESGDYLVVPDNSGILIKNPAIHKISLGGVPYPSGFNNMQFMAYYTTKPSSGFIIMYLDQTGKHVKASAVSYDTAGWLWFWNEHIPPDFKPRLKYTLPYPVAIEIYNGDWWDAAQIYKSWAVKQWWVYKGTISERDDLPEWIKKVGVAADVFTRYWERYSRMWNGPFSNVPRVARAMAEYYGTTPLLAWRGWEKHGFGMAEPDYLPPTEGWLSFTENVAATHENGGRILVFPHLGAYSFNATGWEEARNWAPMDRYGNLYTFSYLIHNNSGVLTRQTIFWMAPGDFMLRTMLNVSIPLITAGVDVIQLDGCPSLPFLNYVNPALPKGGGTWWAENFTKVFNDVRERLRSINSDVIISSEWFAETYLPYLDASNDQVNTGYSPFIHNMFGDKVPIIHIPLWHSVYHEYLILYSTIVITSKAWIVADNSKLFYLRGLAIPLVWGEIPMVDMDPQGEGPPYQLSIYEQDILEYSKRIAQARSTYAYSYLVEGRMLRPPFIENNTIITIPGARSIPYTGVNVPPFNWTSVMASSWAAPDGSIGVVMTNIGPRTTIRISLGELAAECGHNCIAYVVRNGDFLFPIFTPSDKLEVELDQRDVLLLVMTDRSTARGSAAVLLDRSYHLLKDYESRGYNLTEHAALFNETVRRFLSNDFEKVRYLVIQLEQNLRDSVDKLVKELREENMRLKEELAALKDELTGYEELKLRYDSLRKDYEQLTASLNLLKDRYDRLKVDYDAMKSEFQDLLSAYDDLRSMYKTQIGTIYLLLTLTIALLGTITYFAMRRIKHK